MSLVNNTDTPTSPVTGARTLALNPINFDADWRVVSEGANEVTLTNIISPASEPETIRIAWSEINDVFKGSKIEPIAPDGMSPVPTRKGVSLLVQLNCVGKNESTSQAYPVQAHLVLKVPVGANAGGADVKALLARLLGSLYDTAATEPDSRIGAMLRGAIAPKEL